MWQYLFRMWRTRWIYKSCYFWMHIFHTSMSLISYTFSSGHFLCIQYIHLYGFFFGEKQNWRSGIGHRSLSLDNLVSLQSNEWNIIQRNRHGPTWVNQICRRRMSRLVHGKCTSWLFDSTSTLPSRALCFKNIWLVDVFWISTSIFSGSRWVLAHIHVMLYFVMWIKEIYV